MASQKDLFRQGEADRWFERNDATSPAARNDMLGEWLARAGVAPRRVLEIGCSDGWRLDALAKRFACECTGIDPSREGIEAGRGRYPGLRLLEGTAERLEFGDAAFDLIVFGFCLYLCDREDLFRIAAEADRCLQDGGALVVTDFLPPFPYRNAYAHREGVHSYKMDYSRMFTWNPAYVEMARLVDSHGGGAQRELPDERIGSVLMRKLPGRAYPDSPFSPRG